jgi:hypothetical protein
MHSIAQDHNKFGSIARMTRAIFVNEFEPA